MSHLLVVHTPDRIQTIRLTPCYSQPLGTGESVMLRVRTEPAAVMRSAPPLRAGVHAGAAHLDAMIADLGLAAATCVAVSIDYD